MWRLREREIFFMLLSNLVYYSLARDFISPTQSLADGEKLVSASGSFALGFFSPKNTSKRYIGIWYDKITVQTVLWVANRQNPITSNSTSLTISPQGILAISDYNSTVLWSMVSTTINNPIAQLLDTGNFVVRDANSNSSDADAISWQSFDYPTDTLLPGMKVGWNLKTGVSRNYTSWKSASDPSVGPFTLAIDIRGGHELTQFDGSGRAWRSGIWNGFEFSGIPDFLSYGDFIITFVNNTDEIYASYRMANPSTIVRIVMNYTGITERYIWLDSANAWNLVWYTPNSRCDRYNVCGPYGKCDQTMQRVCECLHGFEPKSPTDWALRDPSGGCIRNTSLACGTDGFMTLSNVMVPDTVMAKIDASMSLDECRDRCLRNCSCTGYTNVDVRNGGSGCVMWVTELNDILQYVDAGQDLYVRLAAADLVDKTHQKSQTAIAITISIVLGTLLLACISCFIWRKKKRMTGVNMVTLIRNEESQIKDEDIELPLFDVQTIFAATDNFSMENKLGEGGFGPVYKGKLEGGQEIAVKRLSETSNQGVDEFKNEVLLIAKLQHRNLVRLIGCCTQEERMLIYEYMPHGSLDAFLFDKAESINLDWQTRYHIITGIARGLLYLHEDSRFRIIHRDLKASNVLLDKEMNPKISDFGLARIVGGEEATRRTKRVVGTYGYMSPEYAMDGIFSVKSDVFSFGVLVLEIVSGQRNKGVFLAEPQANLLRKAWMLWTEGRSMELIDPSINPDSFADEITKCIKVGLLCVQENPKARPTMSSVVLMLSNRTDTSFCEPQEPGFMARTDQPNPDSSSSNQEVALLSAISYSLDTGR